MLTWYQVNIVLEVLYLVLIVYYMSNHNFIFHALSRGVEEFFPKDCRVLNEFAIFLSAATSMFLLSGICFSCFAFFLIYISVF